MPHRFHLPSAISHLPSAINHQLSAISHQTSAIPVRTGLVAFCMIFLVQLTALHAQQDIFVPERPGQTWSTDLAAPGYMHFEAGVLMERAAFSPQASDGSLGGGEVYRHTLWQLPAFMLRFGVTDNLEIRAASKYQRFSWRLDRAYFYADETGIEEDRNAGISVVSIGLKTRLLTEDGWRPQMAFIATLALPGLASAIYDISQPAPDLALSFSHTVADDLYLGYCAGLSWDGYSAVPVAYGSGMLTLDLDNRLSIFAEYATQSSYHAPMLHFADAGLVFSASNNLILDAWAGFGIGDPQRASSDPAYSSIYRPDLFIGAGASYRLKL